VRLLRTIAFPFRLGSPATYYFDFGFGTPAACNLPVKFEAEFKNRHFLLLGLALACDQKL